MWLCAYKQSALKGLGNYSSIHTKVVHTEILIFQRTKIRSRNKISLFIFTVSGREIDCIDKNNYIEKIQPWAPIAAEYPIKNSKLYCCQEENGVRLMQLSMGMLTTPVRGALLIFISFLST